MEQPFLLEPGDIVIEKPESLLKSVKPARNILSGNWSRAHEKSKPGQSLLEVAVFLPIIFTLLLAMVYIGLCLSDKMKLEAVSREATRVIAKNTGNGSVSIGIERAREVAHQYGFEADKLEIKIYGPSVSDNFTPARGSLVTAEVTYNLKLFGFSELKIAGKHSEIIECWRTRDDANNGGTCLPPDQQVEDAVGLSENIAM